MYITDFQESQMSDHFWHIEVTADTLSLWFWRARSCKLTGTLHFCIVSHIGTTTIVNTILSASLCASSGRHKYSVNNP